jgi:hypothetical protein
VKRREWTKDDVRELKTLARQKTPVAERAAEGIYHIGSSAEPRTLGGVLFASSRLPRLNLELASGPLFGLWLPVALPTPCSRRPTTDGLAIRYDIEIKIAELTFSVGGGSQQHIGHDNIMRRAGGRAKGWSGGPRCAVWHGIACVGA